MKRKYDEYMDDDETALAFYAAAHAAAEQADLLSRKFVKRIVVKQEYVGRVIGKRSENLDHLKKISGVIVDQSSRFQGYSTVVIADDDRKKVDECIALIENLIASCTGVPAEARNSDHILQVPETSVRLIIGQGGQIVNKLKEEFDVKIIIAPGLGNRKNVQFIGTSEKVAKAKQRVKEILSGAYRPDVAEIQNSESVEFCKTQHEVLNALVAAVSAKHERHLLEISHSDANRLVGKRGKLLKQLQKQSFARIFLDESDKSEKGLVVIIGPPFAVSRAIALVMERLRDAVQVLKTPRVEVEPGIFGNDWASFKASLKEA